MQNKSKSSTPEKTVSPTPVIVGTIIVAIGMLLFGLTGRDAAHRNKIHSSKNSVETPKVPFNSEWFKHPTLPFSAKEIEEAEANFQPIHYLDSENEEKGKEFEGKILEAYESANLMQFSTPSREDIKFLMQRLSINTDSWFQTVDNLGSFVHVGDPLFKSCDDAIQTILDGLQKGNLQLGEGDHLPKSYLETPTGVEYKKSCGDAIPLLAQFGLIKEGKWISPDAPLIFNALQRRRFVELVLTRLTIQQALSPADRYLINWWKTMIPEAFSPQERKNNVESKLDLYPPLNDTSSPYFFDATRAKAAIALQSTQNPIEGKSEVRSLYQKTCQSHPATEKEKEICQWLASNDS